MKSLFSNIIKKSLEELENKSWGDPLEENTALVRECLRLSKVPIGEFSAADLRIMISQGFGLKYLIPLAIDKLKNDIFTEAFFYEGDLLSAVLNVQEKFWKENPIFREQLNELVDNNKQEIGQRKIDTSQFFNLESFI
jgi:hypothetical protein